MIESSTTTTAAADDDDDDDDVKGTGRLLPDDEEHNAPLLASPEGQGTVKPIFVDDQKVFPTAPRRPITSSLRATLSHLRARAGFFAPFRGFGVAELFEISYLVVAVHVGLLLNRLSLTGLARISAYLALDAIMLVLLGPFVLWWVHSVISAPSRQKRARWHMFWQALGKYRQIALPTMVWAAAQQVAALPPKLLASANGFDNYLRNPYLLSQSILDPQHESPRLPPVLAFTGLMLLTFFCIGLPSNVMLCRVYASLLPRHVDAIVPYDRTFGGRIVPEARHGDSEQRLGMLDALRTFDRAAWTRLYKLYGKVCLIFLSAVMVFATVVAVEKWFIHGAMAGTTRDAVRVDEIPDY